MIKLVPRDLSLLRVIDRYGVMSTKQIKRTQFASTQIRTVLRRLRKLERKKLILRHHGLPNGKLVWTLGPIGLSRIGSRFGFSINRNSLEHDVLVTAVRIALDRAELASNWQSAHWLRHKASAGVSPENRFSDQIPDALFMVGAGENSRLVALEVELVAKSKRRYRRIIANYSSNSAIDEIWYVVSAPRIGKLILEEVEQTVAVGKSQNRFVWTDLGQILSDPAQIILRSIDGNKKPMAPAHTDAHKVSTKSQFTRVSDET